MTIWPRFFPDSLISQSSACQALLPLPGSPTVRRLKRPVVGEMIFHQLSQTGPHRLRYVDLPKTFVMLSSMQAAAWAVKFPIGLSAKLLTAFIRPILPS